MARRMDRRSFLARSAAAAAGITLAGVTGEAVFSERSGAVPPPGKTNGPGRNGISTARPKRGGSVTYGTTAEEQGFDPTANEWDEVGYLYGRTIFDPLLAVQPSGKLVPYLAQSVTPNGDYTSWTITVRPNISFHDGTPCDGAALLANQQKLASSILIGPTYGQFIKDVAQTGPLSIRVDTKDPWVSFPYYVSDALQVGYVAAPSMLKNPNGSSNPIGTGPFAFETWQPNSHFTATKNTRYWRRGFPYLDRITYKPILDDNARSEALQAGDIDMMMTFVPQVIVQYRGNRQWSYVDNSGAVAGEPSVSFIQLNCGKVPFDDHGARLALAKAYSQEEYGRLFGAGMSQAVESPFVPGTPYYTKTSYPGYDPSGARRLVEDYQRRSGKSFSFTLNSIPDPEVQRGATYLQARYQNVGIKAQVAMLEENELIANVATGNYEAVTWRQFGAPDPDLNYVLWAASTVRKTGISLNLARNADPRIQQALTDGRSNPNPAVRAKAYQSIGEYLAQDLPYLWLGRTIWAVVAKPSVQNFNNPLAPGGGPLRGMSDGDIWPTQVWAG